MKRKVGPRVRVRSPEAGSDVMSSASSASTVSMSSGHEEPMRSPIDFANLANATKTFPQREEETKSEASTAISSHYQPPEDKRHKREEEPREGFRTIEDEKRDLLQKLKRLRDQKVQITRDYGMQSNINDMRNEYDVIRKNMQVEGSIKFQRKVLVALTSGMEFLNNKYDPFNVELNGWSETIMESITDYDHIFERLHEKYKGSATMPPEFELIMAIAGSAFTFHLSNTFFKKSMGDALKNPNAMKNIMAEIKKATVTAPPTMPMPPPAHQNPMATPIFPMPPAVNVAAEPRPQHTGVQLQAPHDTDSEISVSSDDESVKSSTKKVVQVPSSGRGRGRGRAGAGRGGARGRGRAQQQAINEILL